MPKLFGDSGFTPTKDTDWRLPENRLHAFILWLDWRMTWSDLDHYAVGRVYKNTSFSPSGKPMTRAQAIWYSFIFGMTYQSEMSWVIYWNWPDFDKIDLDELQAWNVKNLDRQKYNKDTKYNKGRIAEQVASMKKMVEPFGGLEAWADTLTPYDDPVKNFEYAYGEVMKLHKFGRMTTWLAVQTLHETAGLNMIAPTLMAHDSSSWSVRSGLYLLYGKDDKVEATGAPFDPSEIPWILETEIDLLRVCKENIKPENAEILTYYLLESHLCQFKKLLIGGDYPCHNSDDHMRRGAVLKELWPEVDFRAFYEEFVPLLHPLVDGSRQHKLYSHICANTGKIVNLQDDYPFMPDVRPGDLTDLLS